MGDENPLAASWKWLGGFLIVQSVAQLYFLATGLTGIGGTPVAEGLKISIALVAAIVLSLLLSVFMFLQFLYLRRNKSRALALPWPPTLFEKENRRDPVISRAMVAIYYLPTLGALTASLIQYSKSIVTKWNGENWATLSPGFWGSRLAAHSSVASYDGLFGIAPFGWEYIPYITDGLLICGLSCLFLSGVFLARAVRSRRLI